MPLHSLQKCYLGPEALALLDGAIKGAVAHLALGSNPIGDEAMIPLLDMESRESIDRILISLGKC